MQAEADDHRVKCFVGEGQGLGVSFLKRQRGMSVSRLRHHVGGEIHAGAETVERVRFIRKAQALGLPLEEVKEVLRLSQQGDCPCGHVHEALSAKLAEVDVRLRELRSFRQELAALVKRGAAPGAPQRKGAICAIVEESATIDSASRPKRPLARLATRRT